jgi:ATP-binding cassette, subfamily B, bacterial
MTVSINAKPGARGTLRAIATAMRMGFRATPSRMIGLTIFETLGQFAGPAQAWGFKLLTDAVVEGDRAGGLRAAALIGGAQVVSDGLTWTMLSFLMAVRERVGQAMDRSLIDLAMGVPGIEHYERPDYQNELRLLRQQRGALANIPDATISNLGLIIRGATTLGLLIAIHPLLALVPLFGVPSVVFGGVAERRRQRLNERAIERARKYTWLYEAATSRNLGKELRVFSARRAMRRRHDQLSKEVTDEITQNSAGTEALVGLGWLIFSFGFVAAVVLVAHQVTRGQATPGDLVLALTLANQINNQLTGAVRMVTFMLNSARVGARFVWLSDYARQATAAVTPQRSAALPLALCDGIVFEDVSFRYPGTDADVLCDVNLRIPAGSTMALVGDNGAGKSTLIKLLCRFYEPTTGRITLDGVPFTDIDPLAWRERMAAGFQDFAKFELVAQASVGIGDLTRVDDADAVSAALDRASALDVIADLPAGLDTQLGRTFEGGVELSGGQWQKIALGRAMMRGQPLLLLLDEPTSALDPQTEHALFERYAGAARRLGSEVGAITVLVSHRFSTVRMADEIVVVSGGRIAEHGTHEALMANAGLYAELYELQARAYR